MNNQNCTTKSRFPKRNTTANALKSILLLLLFLPIQLIGQRTPPEGYTTILSDDFNGTTLNSTYWTKGLYGANGTQLFPSPTTGGANKLNDNYAGYILDKNTVVNNGILELHNIKETVEGTDPAGTFDFSNGWINGLGKIKFNGNNNSIIIKIRMKLPTPQQDDVWPAVWLVEQNDWPGEIDVWEYFGSPFNPDPGWDADDRMVLRYIYGSNFNQRGTVKKEERFFDQQFDVTQFQTYEFEWTDNVMISRIGGAEIGRITKGIDVPDNEWPSTNEEWSLVINNGRMNTTVKGFGLNYCTSNVFEIDWIDVYEADGQLPPPPPPTDIVDPLDDLSQMHSYSANLELWTDSPEYFNGDSSRVCRPQDATIWFMYNIENFTDFEIDNWQIDLSGTLNVYGATSPTGPFTEIPISIASTSTTAYAWDMNMYKPSEAFGNYDYLKIELSGTGFWHAQIGEVRIGSDTTQCDPVTSVSIDNCPVSTLTEGGATIDLDATVSPVTACDASISWFSNNTAVATVDPNGVVTPISAGTATITVTTTDGGFSDDCVITVDAITQNCTKKPRRPTNLSLTPTCTGGSVSWTPPVEPFCAESYIIAYRINGAAWQEVAVSGGSTSQYNLDIVTEVSEITVRMRAVNPIGVGPWTSSIITNSSDCLKTVMSTTDAYNPDNLGITLFPNPVNNGNFKINFNSMVENANISIYNMIGQSVKTLDLKNIRKADIDVSDIKQGTYFVKIRYNKTLVTRKFIIE